MAGILPWHDLCLRFSTEPWDPLREVETDEIRSM
jgi:hypothetical protein